jgi:hypothetical protein
MVSEIKVRLANIQYIMVWILWWWCLCLIEVVKACAWGVETCIKVTTSKCNSDFSRTARKAVVKASQWTQVRQKSQNMFSIPTQGFKSNQWQMRSTLSSQWEVEHFVLDGVQLRTSLVSFVGFPIMSTWKICKIFTRSSKITKPIPLNSSCIC